MNLEIEPHLFKSPFRAVLGGPSMSGKSWLLIEILKSNKKYIHPPPDRIVYCYSRPQSAFKQLTELNIEFVEGLPDIDQFDPALNNLIILDDLMDQCQSNVSILNLFTVDSHHKNISTFLVSQNIFAQGKHSRTISLNCN
jgi:hypothetical protein